MRWFVCRHQGVFIGTPSSPHAAVRRHPLSLPPSVPSPPPPPLPGVLLFVHHPLPVIIVIDSSLDWIDDSIKHPSTLILGLFSLSLVVVSPLSKLLSIPHANLIS